MNKRDKAQTRAVLQFLQRLEADPLDFPTIRNKPGEPARTSVGGPALAFVERYGRPWTFAPLPPDIPRGPENCCYANARDLMLTTGCERGWAYVEGVICVGGHAWCADSDGTVIDNTYPADFPPEEYVGVAFAIGAVWGIKARVGMAEGVLSTIDYAFPWLMDDLPDLLDRRFHPRL